MKELIDEPKHPYLYLVMDCAELGTLSKWDQNEGLYHRNEKIVKKLSPEGDIEYAAKVVFREALKGLEYMHSKGIAHLDLKPDNILVDRHGRTKLCDFTVATKVSDDQKLNISEGTPAFDSPEMHEEGDIYASSDSEESGWKPFPADIWAMGATLYVFMTQKLPFYNEETMKVNIPGIREGKVEFPESFSDSLRQALERMMAKSPDDRPSASECLTLDFFY